MHQNGIIVLNEEGQIQSQVGVVVLADNRNFDQSFGAKISERGYINSELLAKPSINKVNKLLFSEINAECNEGHSAWISVWFMRIFDQAFALRVLSQWNEQELLWLHS